MIENTFWDLTQIAPVEKFTLSEIERRLLIQTYQIMAQFEVDEKQEQLLDIVEQLKNDAEVKDLITISTLPSK